MIKRFKKVLMIVLLGVGSMQILIPSVAALDDTPYYDFLETEVDDAPEP
jgi:hypothetical protein